MLTYQDVISIKLSKLTDAATAWEDMAKGFDTLEDAYKSEVESAATQGETGLSATAASTRFAATRKQFANAQVEARAIASLLRDAHAQFTERIRHVKEIVREAKKDGEFSVNSNGQAVYDHTKISIDHHDARYEGLIREVRDAEAAWTRKIKDAVQAVDDADQGVKLALREAAGVKNLVELMAGEAHTFNGEAVGDIEVYEARLAKRYADQILEGEEDPDSAESFADLMRANSGDKAFSRTLLDELGPEETLKLSNKIDDLAYFDDTKHKSVYLKINGGLSDSLATAMRVPEFKDSEGKRLRFGTEAYNQEFKKWQKKPEADFYNRWLESLHELGDDKYDLKAAGEKVDSTYKGHNQQVRGYQSLATLMQQGHGYSPQFVADVTDDMIAMEKEDPGIWDLYGKFGGKDGDGWFANDPVDAALGVMSRTPEGAAGYLDPGTPAGKERFDYLVGDGDDSRDWGLVNTTRWDNTGREFDADDTEDTDSRKGLGDALTAAATGVSPAGGAHAPTEHTDANNRVFKYSLEVLSGQGDDMPESLRDDMAKVFTNHGREVLVAMSDQSGEISPLDQNQVMEMTKQISRSENSYGMLHEGMNYAMVESFHDKNSKPEDTLDSAGLAVGFMEEARYNALKGDQHDYTWDKAWSYHASGGLLNFIPFFGDGAQRGADVVTTKWIMDEQARDAEELTDNNKETYERRRRQLNALADEWYSVNRDWAKGETGYSETKGKYNKIAAAANDGNAWADGLSGDQ